jgi:hypothetical protein
VSVLPLFSVTLFAYLDPMARFELPRDITFNNGKVADPSAFARERQAASWLCLTGEEFAGMEGGTSYAQVERAVGRSLNVISDPPRVLDLELARRHVAALDELPRPTLVTCRTGPRASAVAYLYSGLRAGAAPDEVLAEAERQGAPFCKLDDVKAWVRESLETLQRERR